MQICFIRFINNHQIGKMRRIQNNYPPSNLNDQVIKNLCQLLMSPSQTESFKGLIGLTNILKENKKAQNTQIMRILSDHPPYLQKIIKLIPKDQPYIIQQTACNIIAFFSQHAQQQHIHQKLIVETLNQALQTKNKNVVIPIMVSIANFAILSGSIRKYLLDNNVLYKINDLYVELTQTQQIVYCLWTMSELCAIQEYGRSDVLTSIKLIIDAFAKGKLSPRICHLTSVICLSLIDKFLQQSSSSIPKIQRINMVTNTPFLYTVKQWLQNQSMNEISDQVSNIMKKISFGNFTHKSIIAYCDEFINKIYATLDFPQQSEIQSMLLVLGQLAKCNDELRFRVFSGQRLQKLFKVFEERYSCIVAICEIFQNMCLYNTTQATCQMLESNNIAITFINFIKNFEYAQNELLSIIHVIIMMTKMNQNISNLGANNWENMFWRNTETKKLMEQKLNQILNSTIQEYVQQANEDLAFFQNQFGV